MRIPVRKIKDTVGDAFNSLGKNFTIRTVLSEGNFDPVSGEVINRTVSDRSMLGVDAGLETKWMPGSTVLIDEYVIYLYDDGVGPPTADSYILFDGKEVAIQKVTEYAILDNRIAYRVVVAK